MKMRIIFHGSFFEFVDDGGGVDVIIDAEVLVKLVDILFDLWYSRVQLGGHITYFNNISKERLFLVSTICEIWDIVDII